MEMMLAAVLFTWLSVTSTLSVLWIAGRRLRNEE
jgi:hypothetical protein